MEGGGGGGDPLHVGMMSCVHSRPRGGKSGRPARRIEAYGIRWSQKLCMFELSRGEGSSFEIAVLQLHWEGGRSWRKIRWEHLAHAVFEEGKAVWGEDIAPQGALHPCPFTGPETDMGAFAFAFAFGTRCADERGLYGPSASFFQTRRSN